MRRLLLVAALLCGIAVFALPAERTSFFGVPRAIAHDVVIDSTPKDNAQVATFPEQIELHFSGVIQDGFNTIAITDLASGDLVYTAEPELDGQFVRVKIPEEYRRDAGEYMVGFQITSSDGHATRGSTRFQVGDTESHQDSATEDEASENSSTTAEESGSPIAYYLVAALALLVAIGAIVLVRKKSSKTQQNQKPKASTSSSK